MAPSQRRIVARGRGILLPRVAMAICQIFSNLTPDENGHRSVFRFALIPLVNYLIVTTVCHWYLKDKA